MEQLVKNTIDTLKRMEEIESRKKEERNNKGVFEIEVKQEVEISKEDFGEYTSCRNSGLTNMFNLSNVELTSPSFALFAGQI